MRYLLLSILFFVTNMKAQTVFDFTKDAAMNNWYVVNDGVMGGLSEGKMEINKEGQGVFSGTISLENYGGFSSVRYRLPEPIGTKDYKEVVLKIKGDGKEYQFRITDEIRKRYSYIKSFTTNGSWQEIPIPLDVFYPSYRGRSLDLPNFNGDILQEITFLIGNKKAEKFVLRIDSITLK
jgi:NADH dehydrogenase [ubiquinone] 1 alpha subcomplex assembly factor 1